MKVSFPLTLVLSVLFIAGVVSCKKDKAKPAPVSTAVEIAGEHYKTMSTATQTWTASNYKGPGGVFYDSDNSKPEYGKYYRFSEVKAVVLPAGWRIPSVEDYIKLAENYGIKFTDYRAINQPAVKKLASATRWMNVNGNNESGFNAYPAGYIYNNGKPMDGDIGEFWTSDGRTFSIQEGADRVSLKLLFYNDTASDGYKFNVRFVKDK